MASFHLHPLPSTRCSRMTKWWPPTQSLYLEGIQSFSAACQKKKSRFKLYMIPLRAVARHSGLTHSAAGIADVKDQQNLISSVPSLPDDYQRNNISDDMQEFEMQLKELFMEVKTLIVNGKKNEAIDILEANFEYVKEQLAAGAKGIEEAALIDIVAMGYLAVGDFETVASVLDMLNKIVDSLKDSEPLLDSVLMHMGSMYMTLEKFKKSMNMYQRAITIMENKYGKDSSFLVTPMLGMAKALCIFGRASKALKIYRHAITILESSRGTESVDLVIPLINMGNLFLREGKAVDAEASFTRILDIYSKLYGENDGRVGLAMCSLARAKCADGKAEEAISLYKKALQIIKNSDYMDSGDSRIEKIRIDLSELLHVVGRGKEGRELLEECLLITEKYKGKEHPSYANNLTNLAVSYSRSKNFAEAERLLKTCLEIMVKTVEQPDDQSITFPMMHLAVTLYHLKRDEEAEELALEALRIREKSFGKDSLPVGEVLDCLVSIQTRMGKDDKEILTLLYRLLNIQERELGTENKEVLPTLKKIIFYLDKLGMKMEKLKFEKRLSTLRTKLKQTDSKLMESSYL